MADTHAQFQEFHEAVRLNKTSRDTLKTSRDANRDRIRKHFREVLKKEVPLFHGQGSYIMYTGVEPLEDEDYDIDDGVYLQGLGTDISKWPTSATVHGWIVDAVKGFTSEPPQDKARCVRVRYAADYHVDLPIYAVDADGKPRIFEKSKSPYVSDPVTLQEWWQGQVSGKAQLRRIVRYLKAWRDYKNAISSTASGLALTLLAAQHYRNDSRDDMALVRTVEAIHAYLSNGGTVCKPVFPYDDLSARWSENQRTQFVARLKTLHDKGQQALDKDDLPSATEIWRGQLGERFPKVEETKSQDQARRTSAPAIIGRDGRSA